MMRKRSHRAAVSSILFASLTPALLVEGNLNTWSDETAVSVEVGVRVGKPYRAGVGVRVGVEDTVSVGRTVGVQLGTSVLVVVGRRRIVGVSVAVGVAV